MNALNMAELSVLDFIQEHIACPFLDAVMPVITSLADAGIFWIALAVFMLFFSKTRKTGLMMGLALVIGLVTVNLMIKPIVGRIRPYELKEGFELLIEKLHDGSFPSGHTLASFEAAGVLMVRERNRFGYPALALAILIAFSRLYLYVHYPTDVAVSIVLGLAYAFVAYVVINYLFKRFDLAKKLRCSDK